MDGWSSIWLYWMRNRQIHQFSSTPIDPTGVASTSIATSIRRNFDELLLLALISDVCILSLPSLRLSSFSAYPSYPFDTSHPSESRLKRSAFTLENDEDGEIIQSSLNEKVRSYTYQLCTAYAVARNPITCRDVSDAVAKSVLIRCLSKIATRVKESAQQNYCSRHKTP